jgi:hypothetical protein
MPPAVNEAKIEIMALYTNETKGKPRIFDGTLIPALLHMDETIVDEALEGLVHEKKLYRYQDGCYSTSSKDPLQIGPYDSRDAFVQPTKLRILETESAK